MTGRYTPPARVTRRRFLAGTSAVGLGALFGSSILAACGSDDDTSSGASTTAGGAAGGRLFFENWPEYIDGETVELFRQASGIDFTYTEAFNDNNEGFAKYQPSLSQGKAIEPDLLAPTSWLASRFIMLEWVNKLPLDQIPNAANLRDDLVNPTWDPTGEFSLPWQTGVTGIAYNISATGRELKSVEDLFDPAFKGKVGMLTEMRDTIGLILLGEGIDPSTTTTFDAASPAFEKLEQAKNDGQIRAFTGNDYLDDLSQGNFACCIGWSGDVVQLSLDNPDVRFVLPEEGGMSWADAMLWIKGSEAPAANVAAWMDFVYDPVNAARITAEVQYVSPVKGVQDELRKMGGDAAALADSPLLFPDAATLQRVKGFANLNEEEETKFDEAFASITGA